MFAAVVVSPAHAHSFSAGDIHLSHPYARPTAPFQPTGGAYLTIENKGRESDKLVKAASSVAKSVEVHTMHLDRNNVMRMREAGDIVLKAGGKILMQPGSGYHLMLLGLKQPLKAGDKFPLTLVFERAGQVEVTVFVEDGEKGQAPAAPRHTDH